MVRSEGRDGSITHFAGNMDAERMVRVQYIDGTSEDYEGEKGTERLVREEWPDGSVAHLDRGRERRRADGAPRAA